MLYLLHFERPLRNGSQHYLGYSKDEKTLKRRIQSHRKGLDWQNGGAKITQHLYEDGIGFKVVRVWKGTPYDEKRLKSYHNHKRYCTLCRKKTAKVKGLEEVNHVQDN